MRDPLNHLDTIFKTCRAPTQRKVVLSLLAGQVSVRDIAHRLGLTENAINISLHELVKAGVVERPIRGRYQVQEGLLALHLSERVSALEKKIIKKRSAPALTGRRPRPASTTAPQPTSEGDLS